MRRGLLIGLFACASCTRIAAFLAESSLRTCCFQSLRMSFQEGKVCVPRGDDNYFLYYRYYDAKRDVSKIPLVILHGGP